MQRVPCSTRSSEKKCEYIKEKAPIFAMGNLEMGLKCVTVFIVLF